MTEQKTILVTGGTSGIGKETAVILAQEGNGVVFTARTKEAGEAALSEIKERSGSRDVSYIECDLASLDSVKRMCNAFLAQNSRIDVLINNAGVMEHERVLSRDGYELDLAVNFLAPYLITSRLLPLLKASAPARIVNVSSRLYQQGRIDFDDLQSEQHFDLHKTYAQSKLALILFTKQLARSLAGTGVTVNALHPGVVDTKMNRENIAHMNPLVRFAVRVMLKGTFLSPEEGARTSVYLATSPEVAGVSGEYFADCKQEKTTAAAEDMGTAERLCAVTEEKYLAPYLL